MQEHIIKQLKHLRTIKPDDGFVSRTRNLFEPQQTKRFSFQSLFLFNWRYASAFAVLLMLVIATSLFFLFPSEETLASLDTKSLTSEAQSLPITIQLEELKYKEIAQEAITSAVTEVSNTEINHLNTSLIEKEMRNTQKESAPTNVDNLLNQVIQ